MQSSIQREAGTTAPAAGADGWTPRVSRVPGAEFLRRRMEAAVIGLSSGFGSPRLNYLEPPGDPGLFGPQSVCWRVHGDFTLMMAGGVCALLLQALHPLALAGVWDHSSFRQDILGRLRRTAAFVGGTTYGSRRDALMLVERVKRIHQGVVGTAPDGRSYAAGDPRLLTWVHVAEVSSFLAAHQRYARRPLTAAEQDRYFEETALVAELLGAEGVPKSRAALNDYFARMLPQLEYGERAKEVRRLLLRAPAVGLAVKPFGLLLAQAGVDLLPGWAQDLMGTRRRGARRAITTPGVRALAPALRWALRNGARARATQRAAGAAQT
ncbi:MAG: DUF2236 domain-containing protein [Nevskia sp.]|nr:DUF2236 domain-containing protein [Nevskia sp.]